MWDNYKGLKALTQGSHTTSQAFPKPVSGFSLTLRGKEGRRCEMMAAAFTFVLCSSRTHCQAAWAYLWAHICELSAFFAFFELCLTVLNDTRFLLQGNRRKACLIKVAVSDSTGKHWRHYRKHEHR